MVNRIHVDEYFDHLGDGYPLGILRLQTRDIASGITVTETLFKSGAIDAKSGIAPNGSYCITYPSVQCPFQPVIRVKPDCSKDSALAGKCLKPTWKFQIDYLTDPELASRMGLRGNPSQSAANGTSTDNTFLSYRQSVVYAGSEAQQTAEALTTGTAGTTTAATATAATTTATAGNTTLTAGNTTLTAGNTTLTAGNTTLTAGNTTLTAGNTTLTAGNTTLTAGNTTVTAGNTTLTAGNTTLTAGNTTVTAGNTTVTAGNTTVTAGNTTLTAGNTNGCFVAGTLIETLAGPRPIETIQKGDWVWSRSLDGTLEAAPVEEALQRTVNEVLDLYLSNGTHIRTTSEHPFWVEKQNDYLRAEQLLKGDVLLGFSTKRTSAVEVTEAHLNRQVSTRVFNLTVAGNHNYFAGGVLVHNKNFGEVDCCGSVNLLFNGTQCCDSTSGNCGTAPPSCSGCVVCVQGGSCACPGDAPGVKSGVNASCPDCKTCGCNCNGTTVCTPSSTTTGLTTGSSTNTGGTTTTGSSTTGGSTTDNGTATTTGSNTSQGNNSAGSNSASGSNSAGSSSAGNSTNTAGDLQISCLACTEASDSDLAKALGSCVGTEVIPNQNCTASPGCAGQCYCCNGAYKCVTQPKCCHCQPFGGKAMDCQTFAEAGCACFWKDTCGSGTTSGGTTTSGL